MKIEIRSIDGLVLFSYNVENNTIKTTVEAAKKRYVSLCNADLANANMMDIDAENINLAGANLAGAYLIGANFTGAYLIGANFTGANLIGAKLYHANLTNTNFTNANLVDACLYDTILTNANFTNANLIHINLSGANSVLDGIVASVMRTVTLDSTRNMERKINIDLNFAIQSHIDWKKKLIIAINKKEIINDETVFTDDQCTFGKWLHGEAKKHYSQFSTYHICIAKHTEFHKYAGDIVKAINEKRFTDAEVMIEQGNYFEISFALINSINDLKLEASIFGSSNC
ncbi:hypothetical protein CCP3SC5AM1_70040 [Gammaproteobacteria bacterium]